ncbi:hypothetical protein LZ31DRAFT_596410 [Colletotrichum somersetense]|nr:hypothetical protein LZ31DRAFT_596410 [Colletotrichum somersetense]
MIELFECLYRSGNLAWFSFTDFQGCSIATIILLLAGILTRDSGRSKWKYSVKTVFQLARR